MYKFVYGIFFRPSGKSCAESCQCCQQDISRGRCKSVLTLLPLEEVEVIFQVHISKSVYESHFQIILRTPSFNSLAPGRYGSNFTSVYVKLILRTPMTDDKPTFVQVCWGIPETHRTATALRNHDGCRCPGATYAPGHQQPPYPSYWLEINHGISVSQRAIRIILRTEHTYNIYNIYIYKSRHNLQWLNKHFPRESGEVGNPLFFVVVVGFFLSWR